MKCNHVSRCLGYFSSYLLATVVIVGGLGCAKSLKSVITGDEEERGPIVPAALSELQGHWQTCGDADSFEIGVSALSRMLIQGEQALIKTHLYSSGDCSGFPEVEITTRSSYRRSNGSTGTTGANAVDISRQSISIRPLTNLGARLLKLGRTCRITDWTAGQERDVTSKIGSDGCLEKVAATDYDIQTVVHGEDGDHLYFGRGVNKSRPDRRPLQINREESFTRM